MKRHRLLVVDDEAATRATLRDILLRAGFEVDTAVNGRDALGQLLDGARPSAIILDARMPVMSGEEFASVVRGYARFSTIPILFLTAWDTRIGFGRDVDAVMRKPFRMDELLAGIQALIATTPPPTS